MTCFSVIYFCGFSFLETLKKKGGGEYMENQVKLSNSSCFMTISIPYLLKIYSFIIFVRKRDTCIESYFF